MWKASPMASGLVGVQSGSTAKHLFRYPSLRFIQTFLRSNKSTFSAPIGSPGAATSLTRNLYTTSLLRQWKNETPPGGLTELYVFRPESQRIWPDPVLGVFAAKDPRCCLPGNVGLPLDKQSKPEKKDSKTVNDSTWVYSTDLFTRFTAKEHQAQTLHSACDYLQNTAEAETTVCNNVLETFPELDGMRNLHCQLQESPNLLKKELQDLFPDRDVINSHLSVITLAQKTQNDMTGWSIDVEVEREMLVDSFVTAAKEICGKLRSDGYWSDFIDPTSGKPYFGQHTNSTFFETDERYRMLGFEIEDLGCCKVITHKEFRRNVFIGTIFTDAHPATGVVQDMFEDMKVFLDGTMGQQNTTPNLSEIPALDQDALDQQHIFNIRPDGANKGK